MRKKMILTAVCILALGAAYTLSDIFIDPSASRLPASTPADYETMKACEKQDVLWHKIQESTYKELPEYRPLGAMQLLAMSKQAVSTKGSHFGDFAPEGWRKFLHGRASIAKVKIVSLNSKYTGLFQGADCGLLRLSLTSAVTSSRPVAPGLALKILRDGTFSTNVSALVSLDGQDQDHNFFKYPMSNIVPVGHSLGQKLVHKIFLSASAYPEELKVREFAEMTDHGIKVASAISPRQLFFVPSDRLKFISSPHEVRNDFGTIPANTAIYQIRAASDKYKDFNYSEYTPEMVKEFLKDSEPVAEIVTTSEFIASAFGDDGIFFRHQLRSK